MNKVDPKNPLRLSCCWLYAISQYGYPVPIAKIPEALERMAALGFHYVELEGASAKGNLEELAAARAEIVSRCDDLGLEVINFCPVIPELMSLDEDERAYGLQQFKIALELADYFDCATIQIDSYAPPLSFQGERPYQEMVDFGIQFQVAVDPDFDWGHQWAVLVETIEECATEAQRHDLPLCLEPRVGEMISNTDALLRLMDHVANDNFGAVLDTAHQHSQKEILPLSVEKLGERILYLHVADNDGRVNEHLALGEGTVDWRGVFQALQKHHFSGYVALDIGRVPDLDGAMRQSLDYLSQLLPELGIAYRL